MGLGPESSLNDGGSAADAFFAKKGARRAASTALVLSPLPRPAPRFRLATRHVVWGVGFLLAMALSTAGLDFAMSGTSGTVAVERIQADASAQVLRRLEGEVAQLKGSVDLLRASDTTRQDESLRGLRKSVDNLKQEIEQVKTTNGVSLAQLSTKLDKTDRDPVPKLTEIMARLDKLDTRQPDTATQKLADVQSRLDRVERQVSSSASTGTIPVAARVVTPTVASAPLPMTAPASPTSLQRPTKLAAKPETSVVPGSDPKALPSSAPTIGGWVLRDVYDGVALVEARGGGLREIAPGEYLPGVGEVRSIERRGKAWVVLTSRGVIENNTW